MQQHLLQDDLTGILHTKSNHGQAITNENNIHASMISNMCAWEIMSRHDGDGFSLAV